MLARFPVDLSVFPPRSSCQVFFEFLREGNISNPFRGGITIVSAPSNTDYGGSLAANKKKARRTPSSRNFHFIFLISFFHSWVPLFGATRNGQGNKSVDVLDEYRCKSGHQRRTANGYLIQFNVLMESIIPKSYISPCHPDSQAEINDT